MQAARMAAFARFYLQEPVVNSGNLSPTYQPSSRRGAERWQVGEKAPAARPGLGWDLFVTGGHP
jgi:hypothetical protein